MVTERQGGEDEDAEEEQRALPLTHRVATVPGKWSALVLDAEIERRLRNIVRRWQTRSTVLRDWGLATRLRSDGLVCYFAGESGTGKTMAAAIIAGELGIPLYRVNVAGLISKYIGETEKNLAAILDGAEKARVALVFDEADAVFAKRSDPKGSGELSHNQQIAYLLDRIERFHGLAFLTTNLDHAMDEAFRRRFPVQIRFGLPDEEQRLRIWRMALVNAPLAPGLDFARLAKTKLSGGSIQKIAYNGASHAAIDDSVVTQAYLEEALHHEMEALGRLV
jgi:SpoVK/Ycf46/Vps4 family AAA+-type ATPase